MSAHDANFVFVVQHLPLVVVCESHNSICTGVLRLAVLGSRSVGYMLVSSVLLTSPCQSLTHTAADNCFTLIGRERSLDLEENSKEFVVGWLDAIQVSLLLLAFFLL